MSAPEIQQLLFQFDQLSNTYLRTEVEEALTRQEEITPHLLRILETVAENPLRYAMEEHNGHVYAALLLSHFREPTAHLPLIRAFSLVEEQLVDLWGDTTTETLPTMLFRTCNGSVEAIKALIVNREVDQYVRCAAMEALSYVVAFDPLKRDEVVEFCEGLFSGEEAARESHFWGNLTATLCDLHPAHSMDIIRKAYDDGIISKGFIALKDVEIAAERDRDTAMESLRTWVTSRMPADIHNYISWFAEFNQQEYTAPPPVAPKSKAEAKKKTERAKNKEAKKTRKKNRG
jgi:hypothetical protein